MSNNNLAVFSFNSNEIRFVDGKPVAKDIATVLGYKRPADTIRQKVFKENKGVANLSTPGGIQSVTVLEEAGIYQLIFSSKLDTAQEFQQWVFSEVLPNIRKTGQYTTNEPALPQTYKNALLALVAKIEEKEKLEVQNALLQEENQLLSEAVDELFDYSSIIRVANYNNISETKFNWRALKCASRQLGVEVKRVPCPRFEWKNLYSHDAWRLAYPKMRLPETTTLVIQN